MSRSPTRPPHAIGSLSRRALLAGAGSMVLAGVGTAWAVQSSSAGGTDAEASPEVQAALAAQATGSFFVRDGLGAAGEPNAFFNRSACAYFRPSTARISLDGPWQLVGEDIVADVSSADVLYGAAVPGSVTLTWDDGLVTSDGSSYPLSISISSVRIEATPELAPASGGFRVRVCSWNALEGIYLDSTVYDAQGVGSQPVILTSSCAISASGAPPSARYTLYLYDIDQPVEDLRFVSGFTSVHLSADSALHEEEASGWLRSARLDSETFDERFACTSLVSAADTLRLEWHARDCGTVIFGEYAGFGSSSGVKEIEDLAHNRAALAYLGATLQGTQFCVINTLVPGTPAAALNGHFVSCDGTDFYGELFEVLDHFGQAIARRGGPLALCRWTFTGTYNDYSWPTHWHSVGGNPIYEDGKVVGHTPVRQVADAWHQYWAPAHEGPQRSPVWVHEALVTGSAAEAVFGPAKAPDLQIGTLDAGHPIEYRAGHCNDTRVEGEDLGPYAWSFTGKRANVARFPVARLHYMVFCVDGVWREVLCDGLREAQGTHSWLTRGGERAIIGKARCGFAVGGVDQRLPASGNYAYIAQMCPELASHVADDGSWLLNPAATELARGTTSAWGPGPRTGSCSYLGGGTGSLGSDGFMGWHFTADDPNPPADELLDGWASGTGAGFVGQAGDPARDPALWAGCHAEGLLEDGLARAEAPEGVRSSLDRVSLVEGDNYVWGVTHATLRWAVLYPGEHGTNAGLDREHGAGAYSNEIDYERAAGMCYSAPATPEFADATPCDLTLPVSLDVRVGRALNLMPYLPNVHTPRAYDPSDADARWWRWRWQGWHTDEHDGRGTPLPAQLVPACDRQLYTGWRMLDGEGVVTTRIYNR